MIPDEWRATLNAVDGNVVEDVARQLQKIPADATHLFISAGGNNALRNADILACAPIRRRRFSTLSPTASAISSTITAKC
jgi:hypothetical protein